MFSLFLILIAVVVCDQSLLKISSGNKDLASYNIMFVRESYDFSDFDTSSIISTVGKICNQTNLENLYSECIKKYESYNQEWVKFF